MERLQEAIEKARAERQGKIGRIENNPDTVVIEKPDDAPNKVSGSDKKVDGLDKESEPQATADTKQKSAVKIAPEPADVTYSVTRTIDVDEHTLTRNRVIAGFYKDHRVEAYRQLRSQVLGVMKLNNWNTLAVTSPGENAGKTLTAINLAISISQEVNQTVMLVDLDLRKPNIHQRLGVEAEKGITDCLQHGEPMENILFNPGFPRLVVMPGRALGRHSSEILSSPEMKTFLEEVRSRYKSRIIIFDLPPLLRNDDALVFTPNVDASLLVVEDGVTTPDDIKRSLQLLDRSHLIGTILNKAQI